MKPDFSNLRAAYADRFGVFDLRPGIQEIQLPVYSEDGDPLHIYLRHEADDSYHLTDLGATLMKLSYNYNLDTEARTRALEAMLRENRVKYSDGEIYLPVTSADLYPHLLHFAQVLGKVSAMEYWRREEPQNLFNETLRRFVYTTLQEYDPHPNVSHLGEHDDYKADYRLTRGLSRPTYLFGVTSSTKAGDTNSCLLAYQSAPRPFYSIVVYGDSSITRKYQRRLAVLADKTFLELEDFIDAGAHQIRRSMTAN